MEARRRTWFDERGLVVAAPGGPAERGERHLPLYACAMQYWRIDPKRWSASLDALHSLGMTCVETFVPWRIHEPEAGTFVWTGERDLARFLDLARAAGLSVIVRPGPRSSAELTNFGFPDWLLADPDCQARTAHGTPAWLPAPPRAFPIPSYASTKFHARVRAWYAAVADVVRPHLAPEGPVVAIGVDTQAQHFFRLSAFDLDYHPDALAWWREHSGLDGEDAEPPREWSAPHAARCILWLKHKAQYLARALGEFCRSLDEVGLGGIARFHDLPPGHYGLSDIRELQHAIAGPVGLAAYTPRSRFPELRRRALSLAGNAAPLPLALEVSIGFFPWLPPLDEADDPTRERDHLLTLLACGVRGFNVVTAAGQLEPHAKWIAALVTALDEVDWPALRRRPAIALVDTRADARVGMATNVIDPVTAALADVLELGPGGFAELGTDAAAIASRRWQVAIARALELAQVPYAIVDEATPQEELASYRAIIAPTPGTRIDRGLWQRLRSLAEHKRSIVVVGPVTPTHDELDQPLHEPSPKRIGKLKEGSLEDIAGLADDLASLAGETSEAWHVERPETVRTMPFADPSGATRVVFLVSDAERATTAVVLAADGTSSLRDVDGVRLPVDGGRVNVPMPARGVRMLIVEQLA